MRYDFRNADFDLINSIFDSVDWNAELSDLSAQDAWELVEANLLNCIECIVPSVKKRAFSKKPGWMSRRAKNAINRKHHKWRAYKRSPNQHNWNNFVTQRNRTTEIIRSAKADFEVSLLRGSKDNPKALFSYLSTKKQNAAVECICDEAGNVITESRNVASQFGKHFAKISWSSTAHSLVYAPGLGEEAAPTIDRNELELKLKNLNPSFLVLI